VNDEFSRNDMPTYRVPGDVVMAVKDGKEFVPKSNENLSPGKYFKILHNLFDQRKEEELSFESLVNEERDLASVNGHLIFVQKMKHYEFSAGDAVILLRFCDLFVNKNDENIEESDLAFIFDEETGFEDDIFSNLKDQSHTLIKCGLV
jgi:hypothetical protein